MSVPPKSDEAPENRSFKSGLEWTPRPSPTQLSAPDRVHTDVSSLAVERGMLGMASGATDANASTLPAYAEGLTDAELMLRVKAGDTSAFDYLVHKYRRAMVAFMYRMCHNQGAAEDLAQEVFLRVFRTVKTFRSTEGSFATWLARVTRNLLIDHYRRTRQERVISSPFNCGNYYKISRLECPCLSSFRFTKYLWSTYSICKIILLLWNTNIYENRT
jgi:hypothetical protein